MATLTEEQIRILARIAREELGDNATLERLRDVVKQAAQRLESGSADPGTGKPGRVLAILVSCDGLKNSRVLSRTAKESGCRITERLERNLAGFHVLLAVVDVQSCTGDFDQLRRRFSDAGNAVGVRVILQAEETLKSRSG